MKHQLLVNEAAGKYKTKQWSDEDVKNWRESGYSAFDGHFTEVGLYDTPKQLQEAIEEQAGPTVHAVFFSQSSGEGFVSEENNLSGNWRGTKYPGHGLMGEYPTSEETDAQLDTLEKE